MIGPSLSAFEEWAVCQRCGADFVHVKHSPVYCTSCHEIMTQQLYDELCGVYRNPDKANASQER